MGSSNPLPSGGVIREYVITGLKGNANFSFGLTATYVPEAVGEALSTKLSFSQSDTPWYY